MRVRGVRGRGRRGRDRPRGAPAHLRRRRLRPDHRGRLRLRRVGRQGGAGVPGRPLRDHRRRDPRRRPERRQPGLRRGAGLVPGRRGRRAEDRGRPHRLRRRRRDPADPEVPGRLRGGRQGGQPRHHGRRHLPDPGAGLLRLRRPGQGQDRRRRACTTAARTSSTTLPAAPVAVSSRPPPRPATLGDRCRLRPVQHRRPVGPGRHPDLDAQERERRGLRLPRGGRRRRRSRPASPPTTWRSTASATPPAVASSTTSPPTSTGTSSRSSTARSRFRPRRDRCS